jgi:tripartite-type tricarboxylate transporter receptor subunit TctC
VSRKQRRHLQAKTEIVRVALAIGASIVCVVHAASAAQVEQRLQTNRSEEFPARPIRLVAAQAPGGGVDIIGRIAAQGLAELWREQVVVDNRGGAAGAIATETVVKSTPDGYTLLVQSLGVSYLNSLRRNLGFDVTRDLTPIVPLASQPSLLAVHNSVPATTVAELIQLAKSKPGQLHYGTSGAGGASHMGTELFSTAAHVRLTPVAYKGTGPAMTALLGGEVQLAMVGISTTLPHAKAGRIRALAVTGAARSPLVPDVPTVSEAGVPGFAFDAWYALFGPARMAPAVTRRSTLMPIECLHNPRHVSASARLASSRSAGVKPNFENSLSPKSRNGARSSQTRESRPSEIQRDRASGFRGTQTNFDAGADCLFLICVGSRFYGDALPKYRRVSRTPDTAYRADTARWRRRQRRAAARAEIE